MRKRCEGKVQGDAGGIHYFLKLAHRGRAMAIYLKGRCTS
jgi:hypothetical protein